MFYAQITDTSDVYHTIPCDGECLDEAAAWLMDQSMFMTNYDGQLVMIAKPHIVSIVIYEGE